VRAYLARLRPLRRQLLPLYSLIVLTAPLSDAQWAEIGWQDDACLASNRYTVDYLSRTADGRILFGGRGAPYHFGSRIDDAYDRHEPIHAMLRRMAIAWFPTLKGVEFTHAWGGPLGMPRDWMPTMSYDAASGIATARGYTGQGVATSNVSGRVLSSLICGTPLSLGEPGAAVSLDSLPMVGYRPRPWEPEPLRWLGVRGVQRGLMWTDDRAERTGCPPSGRSVVERLGAH